MSQVANKYTYQRHQPEQTMLYQLVERHYPDFQANLSPHGKSLPYYIEKELKRVTEVKTYVLLT
ncbi:hypothetical protein [Glaciecola sp. MH2013]|uniref:hypothetical protein n=1 Tax=Glaciecola sp. MH2013 TaxID=2785524 RepID=UPI00189F9C18|nr:hypothetical protein [Glaciecola sp. MH2013]